MEKSASTVGLSYRWVIKSVLVLGLFVAMLGGIAVWLQTVLVLFGPKEIRFKLMTLEWPEEAAVRGGKIKAG
jgi:TRAP-type mannitol/chloroaromatic compound transport system permease small subunit